MLQAGGEALARQIHELCSGAWYEGHDESTYKSGEISAKRWIVEDNAPFYNKGRGRSIMASEFLVTHNSGPFFSLNDKEFKRASNKYPDLNNDSNITYET
ncbi:unnamed protein product [Rotaria magnacalcarata]|uniref:Uncharacterized protein n=1 Tax=Rotaria magnacalcarata TaxID=392030 RepID=A0A816W7Q2_9BILA|nr:unnamed protein product [Rotaria magnacalcarata]